MRTKCFAAGFAALGKSGTGQPRKICGRSERNIVMRMPVLSRTHANRPGWKPAGTTALPIVRAKWRGWKSSPIVKVGVAGIHPEGIADGDWAGNLGMRADD